MVDPLLEKCPCGRKVRRRRRHRILVYSSHERGFLGASRKEKVVVAVVRGSDPVRVEQPRDREGV
jgi:hypothetical protein